MNYDSRSMKKVATEAAVRAGKPGSFAFEDVVDGDDTYRRLWVHFPDGTVGGLALDPAPASLPKAWAWNGSTAKPTITDLIRFRGRWEGRIKGGRLVGGPREEVTHAEPQVTRLPPPNPALR